MGKTGREKIIRRAVQFASNVLCVSARVPGQWNWSRYDCAPLPPDFDWDDFHSHLWVVVERKLEPGMDLHDVHVLALESTRVARLLAAVR